MSIAGRSEDKVGHLPLNWGKRLLNNLAVGWVKGNLFFDWRGKEPYNTY